MLRSVTRNGPAFGSRAGIAALVLALGCAPSLLGCDEEKQAQTPDAGAGDGGAKPMVVDPKLNAAMAAAASSGAMPAGPGGGSGAPPETGVFTPGAADRMQPRSATSKVELLGEGSEPRVSLAPKLDGAEQKLKLTVALRTAQSGLPTIDFALAIKAEKPKEGDKPKEGEAPKPAPAKDAGLVPMVAKVTSASLAPAQPGQVPKEAGDAISKIKGSAVRWQVNRDGAATGWNVELAKGAHAELEIALRAAADALASMHVPVPAKPVGVGAYWMVSDRANSTGIDVVRYRVMRVEKVDEKAIKLSIELRQYAADPKIEFFFVPKNADVVAEHFESQGKGSVELSPGGAYPNAGDLSQRLQAKLRPSQAPAGQQGQQQRGMMIQAETAAKISSPAPADAPAAKPPAAQP
jgi:hypothetical protein